MNNEYEELWGKKQNKRSIKIRNGLMNLIYIIHLIFFVSYYKIGWE